MTELPNSNSAYLPEEVQSLPSISDTLPATPVAEPVAPPTPEKEGYTPLADITPADIGQYGEENGWSPQKMAEVIKETTKARIDRAETKYKDDPAKYASEYRIIQEQTPKALQALALEEAKQRALAVNLGDRESANDMLTLMTKPPVQLVDGGQSPIQPDHQATHVDEIYGSDYVNSAFKDPAFQLNEKNLIDDRTIEDGKGNSYGNISTVKGADGKRTALVTLNKTIGKSAGEKVVDSLSGGLLKAVATNYLDDTNDQSIESSDVRKYSYTIPTDEEVVKHIEDTKKALAIANKKVEDNNNQNKFALEHPEAYGEAGPAINITMSADRQVKAAKEKARLESELSFLERASMPQAKEYLGEKRLNSIIVNDPKTKDFTNDLNLTGDVLDGALRFRAATANTLSNGSADAENDLNTINKDGAGSTLIGEAPDSLKSLASQAAQSVGFQLIPFVAGAGAGYALGAPVLNTAGVLGGMGVGSYGAQLAQTDNMIESAAETIKNKYKKNPFDASIKEDEAELVRLKENREANALGHAIVETGTEMIGGYGGLILPKIKNPFINTLVDAASEVGEEFIAEPANQLVDYMTYGERLTPEQASSYSIAVTTLMSLPPLLGGGHLIGGAMQSKADNLKAATTPTPANPVVPAGTVLPALPATPNGSTGSKSKYEETIDNLATPVAPEARQAAAQKGAAALTTILPAVTQATEQLEQTTAAAKKATAGIITAIDNPKPETKPDGTPIRPAWFDEPIIVTPDQIVPDSHSTEKPVPDNHVRIPVSKSSLVPVTPPEAAPASGEAKPKAPEPTHVDIPHEVLNYGLETFPSFKDFGSWAKGMAQKFGEGIKEHLQSLWDWLHKSYNAAYDAIDEAVGLSANSGLGLTQDQKKGAKLFRKYTTNLNPSQAETAEIQRRFPALFKDAMENAQNQVTTQGNTIDGINPKDLARLYAFHEQGFRRGGSLLVDVGTPSELTTHDFEGPSFVDKKGRLVPTGGVQLELLSDEQAVLKALYGNRVISEDQLETVITSIFRKRKFVNLYGAAKGKGVEHLRNPANSTINPETQVQSKIKEADSVGAILDPNKDSAPKKNSIIASSILHGTTDSRDALTYLGIKGEEGSNLDEAGNKTGSSTILTSEQLSKLYDYYDSIFGENNWVIKDSHGEQSSGFYTAEESKADLEKNRKAGTPNYLLEGIAQEKLNIAEEFRVNMYVDKKGNVRVIPFATNIKTKHGQHNRPYAHETSFTKALQSFAQKALEKAHAARTDKSTGLGAVYGMDIAMVNNKDGSSPLESAPEETPFKVIEFNPPDAYNPKVDAEKPGGATGTFSDVQGLPTALLLNAFLEGRVPADIALTNVLTHLLKSGKMTANGKVLTPSSIAKTNSVAQETKDSHSTENPNSNLNSGIDPTRLAKDLQIIYRGTKDLISFTAAIIQKIGQWIAPYAKALWREMYNHLGVLTESFLVKNGILLNTVQDIKKLKDATDAPINLFLNAFSNSVKQKDRKIEDVIKIASNYVSDMLQSIISIHRDDPDSYDGVIEVFADLPDLGMEEIRKIYKNREKGIELPVKIFRATDFIARPSGYTFDMFMRMADGRMYDPDIYEHAVEASDLTKKLASMDEDQRKRLLKEEENRTWIKRTDSLHAVIEHEIEAYRDHQYHAGIDEYPSIWVSPKIIEVALLLKAISKYAYEYKNGEVRISEITKSNRNLVSVMPGDITFITNEIKKDKDLKTAFKDGVEAITKANITSSSNRGWVKHNRSDKEEDVIQLTKDAAGTPWCTKFDANARSQLSRGDFYTYHNNQGKAIVAIRTEDGTIEEIRGTEDNQDLKQEEFDIAEKFLRESKLNGGEEFLADADLKKKLMSASSEELYEIGLKNINNNGEIVKYSVRADGKYLSRLGRNGEPIYIPKLNKIRKSFSGAIGYGSTGEYPYVVQQRVNDAFQNQWVEFLEEGKIWDGIGEVPKDGIVEILNYNNEIFAPTNGLSGPIRINKETGINKINFAIGYLVVTDHDLDIGILNGDIAAVGKSKITIKKLNGIFSAEGSSSVSIDKASKESEIKMMESSYGKMGKIEGIVELLGNSSVVIDESVNARIMSKDQSTITIKDLKRTERGHLSVYSTSKAFVDNASNPNIMLRGNSSLYAKKINGGEINTEMSSMASIDELTGSILNANGWSNVSIERVSGKHSINVIEAASVHIGTVKGTKDDLEMSGSGWLFRPVIKAVGFKSLITIGELDFKEAHITRDYAEDDRHSGINEEEKARTAITIDKYIAGEVDLEFGGIQILNRVNSVDEGTYIMSIIGVDPTRIVNDIKTIYKGTKDFIGWSAKMIKKFGEKIRPLLNSIFSQLKQFAGEITEDFLHKIGVIQYAQDPKANTPVRNAKQNATKDYNPDNYIRLDGNIKVDKSYLDPAHLAKAEKLAAIIAKKNKGVNAGIMSHTDIMTNIAEIKANEEDNKFIQLKKQNLSAFLDYNYDRTFKSDPEKKLSYKEAKQILLDQLDQLDASDPIDDKKARPDSEARRSAIKSLKRNLGIAEKYKQSDEFKNLPENIKRFLIMGIAGINESITDESSTNNIKRAAIALASLTDDGSPVGMFKFAYEKFHVENIDKIKAIEATTGKPLHALLSNPIGVLRRMDFFGDKTGTGGSVASTPLEVAKMSGGFDQVEQWLQNLYSIFVANLDHQSAEYSHERELFNEYVNSLFPRGAIINSLAGTHSSMSVEESVRIGIASILTQYEVNSLDALGELERASENVFNGIEFRKNVPHERWNALLDEKAFNALMQGIDYRSMTADQVVQAIEANMTSPERSVLYYARSKSAQYLPSLRVVAGISGNRLLSEYTNYVKTSQRKGPTEERPMGGALAFDNMQSVVMERKGLSHDGTTPNSRVNGYYETSILQLMNTFLDEASYEKHTGVERTMIRQLLNDNRFTDNLEEPDQRVNKPRVNRMKTTLGNYHSSRIGNTNHFGRAMGVYLTLSSLAKGRVLISLPMFMGNTASAIINSIALSTFTTGAMRMLGTVMSEYSSSGQIRRDSDKWLADNFPSQLRRSRTEEISLALRPGPNKGLERAQKELAAGRNQLITYLENGFQIAFGVVADKLAGGIINRLSHLSAASAETMSSKLGVWASYISQLNEKGHSYDTLEEFLLNPVVDNEAMTSAMFTIDKMTGIASMKESQGGFYHLDTKVKVIMNDTLMVFGRQLSQMTIQAGTELSQVAARGLTTEQRAKHLARFANILSSVLAYSYAKSEMKALLYGGTVLAVPFIAQFISNEDDEKKKKAIRDELERVKLNEKRKTHFNYVSDTLVSATGFTPFNTSIARNLTAQLFDNLESKEEDKLLDLSIAEAQKELASMKVLFNSDLKTKGIDGVSKLSSTMMAQEDKIESMKRLKGVMVEPYGERVAKQFTGVLGSDVIDIAKYVIDKVSTSETEDQLRLEETGESMTTIEGRAMSAVDAVLLQSGFKQSYKATIRKLAQDRIKQENADAKATELMDRRVKNKAGKNE